jgi:CubicO group peptidase (beta-lactamase class C family)
MSATGAAGAIEEDAVSSVQGRVRPELEPVRERFAEWSAADPDWGAQLCMVVGDDVVVDLTCGPGADALTGVYSVSKGVAATVIALLLGEGVLELDRAVAHYWPEFAAAGKSEITVRQLLSHQAGLSATDDGIRPEDALDSRAGAERLARQRPLWRPGAGFGYHGITIGILMEELARRTTGAELQDLYESRIRAPRDIDFFLGLPDDQAARYVDPRPPLLTETVDPGPRDNLFAASFGPLGRAGDAILTGFGPHSPEVRRQGTAAAGGVGSARGLARLYAATLGNVGGPIAPPETFAAMSQVQVLGRDMVLDIPLSFGIVFMKPHIDMPFASFRSYGHDGAGGAIAFADPVHDMAFGYVPTRMTIPGGVDARAIELSRLARVILGAARA